MDQQESSSKTQDEQMPAAREVFLYFLLLGFINIGGPVAQITMMYNKMVERSHWLSKDRFVKIMGFAHMLPGPGAAACHLCGLSQERHPRRDFGGTDLYYPGRLCNDCP